MRSGKSERGSALLAAIGALVVFGLLLNVAANGLWRATDSLQQALDADLAGYEARGGVRWAAERLARGGRLDDLSRRDDTGILEVSVEGDRIRSTYAVTRGRGRDVTLTVGARWRRSGKAVVVEWSGE